MRKTVSICLMNVGVALMSQAPPAASPMARLLEMRLQDSKTGTIVILDSQKNEWKSKVDAMVLDPAWIDLELSLRYYGQKSSEVGPWLMGKYAVGPGPCWALFAEKGKLAAFGSSVPTVEVLAKAAQEAGIKTESGILREFLRANPDHLEAQEQLLNKLVTKALAKMKLKTGERQDPVRPADEKWDYEKYRRKHEAELEAKEDAKAKSDGVEKPVPDLQAEEDQAIWGEVADRFGGLFRSGDWSSVASWSILPDESAARSPRMRDVCIHALPEVEAALGRRPNDWSVWSMWLGLSKIAGGRPIRPLLDSLTPLPTASASEWPPYMVRDAYVKDARARADWQGIKDLLLPQWEHRELRRSVNDTAYLVVQKAEGKIQVPEETGDDWRDFTEPLVEALLRLGETNLADRIVTASFAQHPWSGLPKRSQQLALRCNQPSLAAQWGALLPPAK